MIRKIKSQLNKLKQKFADAFDEDGTPKIDFKEILELQDKIKRKEFELYKEREWNKIIGGNEIETNN